VDGHTDQGRAGGLVAAGGARVGGFTFPGSGGKVQNETGGRPRGLSRPLDAKRTTPRRARGRAPHARDATQGGTYHAPAPDASGSRPRAGRPQHLAIRTLPRPDRGRPPLGHGARPRPDVITAGTAHGEASRTEAGAATSRAPACRPRDNRMHHEARDAPATSGECGDDTAARAERPAPAGRGLVGPGLVRPRPPVPFRHGTDEPTQPVAPVNPLPG
jgi:hypothetical protein